MAYETGTLDGSATTASLLAALGVFAAADGWTVNESSTGYIRLTKGVCTVSLTENLTVTMNDTAGPSGNANAPDHCIEGRLGSYTAPQIIASSERVRTNDLTPPFANYWFFSGGPEDPPYIHVVVQKASGRFSNFSFGVLDKKGVGHTGGAFLIGNRFNWGFASTQINSNTNGSNVTASGHYMFGSVNTPTSFSTLNLSAGDLDAGLVIADYSNASYTNGRFNPLFTPTTGFSMGSSTSRWFGHFFHLGPNPVNGVTPLLEIPVMRFTSNSRLQYYGSMPNWRYCSMIGRDEAETVSFAGEEWMIFPFKRARPWTPEPIATRTVTSGPYGFAVKKVE